MGEVSELERLISIRIIQEDVETISSLLANERNPIFAMEIIPYFALFIQSYQEYMGESFLSESEAIKIKDIRNHIKYYADTFGKSKRKISSVDQDQDSSFRSQLRFDFLKRWNIHLNLGTYWTDDRRIVGNTQQLAGFLGMNNIFDSDVRQMQYELGYQIGSFVASVRDELAKSFSPPVVNRAGTSVAIKYYYDINTNKQNILFGNDKSKELSLFFLHLLCNMNFTKYVLMPLFPDGNIWIFRIEYIVTYYTFRALQRLRNYCENNSDVKIELKEINEILRGGEGVFKSKFRNCMMHYNLENQSVLSSEKIQRPFFGIVENCFEGMDYYTYLNTIRNLSDRIIAYLEKQFNCSSVKLQRL